MVYEEICLDLTMLPKHCTITDTSLVLEPSCVNKSWLVLYQFYLTSRDLKPSDIFANTVLKSLDFESGCTCSYNILLFIPHELLPSFSIYYTFLIVTSWFN